MTTDVERNKYLSDRLEEAEDTIAYYQDGKLCLGYALRKACEAIIDINPEFVNTFRTSKDDNATTVLYNYYLKLGTNEHDKVCEEGLENY